MRQEIVIEKYKTNSQYERRNGKTHREEKKTIFFIYFFHISLTESRVGVLELRMPTFTPHHHRTTANIQMLLLVSKLQLCKWGGAMLAAFGRSLEMKHFHSLVRSLLTDDCADYTNTVQHNISMLERFVRKTLKNKLESSKISGVMPAKKTEKNAHALDSRLS